MQHKQGAYQRLFLLRRQRLNRLYARDTRRDKIVQVIGGKNGAHCALRIGGERGVASPRRERECLRSDSAKTARKKREEKKKDSN